MFVEWAGVVRGRVHIGLLQWVEAGFVIRDQVILVQSLELHGCVLLILGGAPTLVVQVVGGGRMDECGLLGLALAVLAGQVHCQGQQPRAQEAGDARSHQVDETEPSTAGGLLHTGGRQDHGNLIVGAGAALAAVSSTGVGPWDQLLTAPAAGLGSIFSACTPLRPRRPAFWAGLRGTQCLLCVQPQTDVLAWGGRGAGARTGALIMATTTGG